MNPRDSVELEHYSKANIMPIENRVDCLKLNHMHKIYNNNAPSYLCETFIKTPSNYSTRDNKDAFSIPHCKTQGKNSFLYSATVL